MRFVLHKPHFIKKGETMNDLYKKIKKDNDKLLKEVSGEYAYFLNQLVKEIRKYAIKSQGTESELKKIIEDLRYSYQQNIRFSTAVPNKTEYIENVKANFVKGNNKPKYTPKEIIIISICLITFFGLAIWGIILKQPVDFETPKEVKISNGIFSFQEVKYAKEYVIRCTNAKGQVLREIWLDDEDPEVINIQTYDVRKITELKEPGTYIIKVKVISNNVYKDSKWSEEVTYVNLG